MAIWFSCICHIYRHHEEPISCFGNFSCPGITPALVMHPKACVWSSPQGTVGFLWCPLLPDSECQGLLRVSLLFYILLGFRVSTSAILYYHSAPLQIYFQLCSGLPRLQTEKPSTSCPLKGHWSLANTSKTTSCLLSCSRLPSKLGNAVGCDDSDGGRGFRSPGHPGRPGEPISSQSSQATPIRLGRWAQVH